MSNFTPFDAADYLDSDEAVAAYLSAALDDDDPDFFLTQRCGARAGRVPGDREMKLRCELHDRLCPFKARRPWRQHDWRRLQGKLE